MDELLKSCLSIKYCFLLTLLRINGGVQPYMNWLLQADHMVDH